MKFVSVQMKKLIKEVKVSIEKEVIIMIHEKGDNNKCENEKNHQQMHCIEKKVMKLILEEDDYQREKSSRLN